MPRYSKVHSSNEEVLPVLTRFAPISLSLKKKSTRHLPICVYVRPNLILTIPANRRLES